MNDFHHDYDLFVEDIVQASDPYFTHPYELPNEAFNTFFGHIEYEVNNVESILFSSLEAHPYLEEMQTNPCDVMTEFLKHKPNYYHIYICDMIEESHNQQSKKENLIFTIENDPNSDETLSKKVIQQPKLIGKDNPEECKNEEGMSTDKLKDPRNSDASQIKSKDPQFSKK